MAGIMARGVILLLFAVGAASMNAQSGPSAGNMPSVARWYVKGMREKNPWWNNEWKYRIPVILCGNSKLLRWNELATVTIALPGHAAFDSPVVVESETGKVLPSQVELLKDDKTVKVYFVTDVHENAARGYFVYFSDHHQTGPSFSGDVKTEIIDEGKVRISNTFLEAEFVNRKLLAPQILHPEWKYDGTLLASLKIAGGGNMFQYGGLARVEGLGVSPGPPFTWKVINGPVFAKVVYESPDRDLKISFLVPSKGEGIYVQYETGKPQVLSQECIVNPGGSPRATALYDLKEHDAFFVREGQVIRDVCTHNYKPGQINVSGPRKDILKGLSEPWLAITEPEKAETFGVVFAAKDGFDNLGYSDDYAGCPLFWKFGLDGKNDRRAIILPVSGGYEKIRQYYRRFNNPVSIYLGETQYFESGLSKTNVPDPKKDYVVTVPYDITMLDIMERGKKNWLKSATPEDPLYWDRYLGINGYEGEACGYYVPVWTKEEMKKLVDVAHDCGIAVVAARKGYTFHGERVGYFKEQLKELLKKPDLIERSFDGEWIMDGGCDRGRLQCPNAIGIYLGGSEYWEKYFRAFEPDNADFASLVAEGSFTCLGPACRKLYREEYGRDMPEPVLNLLTINKDKRGTAFLALNQSDPSLVAFNQFRYDSWVRLQRQMNDAYRRINPNLRTFSWVYGGDLPHFASHYPFSIQDIDKLGDFLDGIFLEICYGELGEWKRFHAKFVSGALHNDGIVWGWTGSPYVRFIDYHRENLVDLLYGVRGFFCGDSHPMTRRPQNAEWLRDFYLHTRYSGLGDLIAASKSVKFAAVLWDRNAWLKSFSEPIAKPKPFPGYHGIPGDTLGGVREYDAEILGTGFLRMIQWEYLFDKDINRLGNYKVLILPSDRHLSPELAKNIELWVRSGGLLITEGDNLRNASLREILGAEIVEEVKGEFSLDMKASVSTRGYRVKPRDGAEVVSYASGQGGRLPWLVMNKCGRGRAIYSSLLVTSSVTGENEADINLMLRNLIRKYVPLPVESAPDMETNLFRGENFLVLGILSHSSAETTTTVETNTTFPAAIDVLEMKKLPSAGKKMEITIKSGETKFFYLGPEEQFTIPPVSESAERK